MASAGDRSNLTKFKSNFSDQLKSPQAFLAKIGEKLSKYHHIQKDRYKNLEPRVTALKELSRLASEYFKVFKVDLNEAARRPKDVVKHKFQARYQSGSPAEMTVERNILTLARRSLRKAEYLRLLRAFYGKGGAGANWQNADAFLAYLREPQKKDNLIVGLSPGVRLE
jgi:hypothetical protein